MNKFKKILQNYSLEIQSNIKYLVNEFVCDNKISFNELYEIISAILDKEQFTKHDLKKNIYPCSFHNDLHFQLI